MTFGENREVGEDPIFEVPELPAAAHKKIPTSDWDLFILETEDTFEIHISKRDVEDLKFAALIERGCGLVL